MSLAESDNDLKVLSVEQLRARLATALAHTARGLAEMAACVQELEARGEDLSGLKLAIIPYLRRIACGQLLPEVVVHYAGIPQLLAAVATLPLPDQRQLLDSGTVPVAFARPGGGIDVREIDPRALRTRDLPRIFSPEGIRPAEKQQPKSRSRGPARQYKVRVDAPRRMLHVGKAVVPLAEVLTAISDAAGYGGEIDALAIQQNSMPRAATNLTPQEKERLVAMAEALRISEWELVRRAVLTWLI